MRVGGVVDYERPAQAVAVLGCCAIHELLILERGMQDVHKWLWYQNVPAWSFYAPECQFEVQMISQRCETAYRGECIQKAIPCGDRALRDEGDTVRPAVVRLKKSVPVLE